MLYGRHIVQTLIMEDHRMPVPSLRAYVGSYANPAGSSEPAGIRVFELDPATGALSLLSSSMPDMEAGFLWPSADGRFIYGVDERKNDGRGPVGPLASVKAFAVEPGRGGLELLNSQPAFGAFPTYVNADPSGRWLVTASHGSFQHVERVVRTAEGFRIECVFDDSTLALYPIDASGRVEPACDLYIFEGHGKDPSDSPQVGRHPQASPHAHSATFDPSASFVMVCEKSTDRIYTFAFDPSSRKLGAPRFYQAPIGSAPRHPVFHPRVPLVFVTNEMSSTLSSYRYDKETGELSHLHTVPTIPVRNADNAPADVQLHPAGKILVVNNRGLDNLVSFWLDEASGDMTQCDTFPLAKSVHPGLAARNFAFDPSGQYLLVADRPANTVLSLAVDDMTGRFKAVSSTPVPQPAFVLVTESVRR